MEAVLTMLETLLDEDQCYFVRIGGRSSVLARSGEHDERFPQDYADTAPVFESISAVTILASVSDQNRLSLLHHI
jgi:hypothetical protein